MPFPNDNSYFPFGPSPISSRSQFSSSVQLNDHIMATSCELHQVPHLECFWVQRASACNALKWEAGKVPASTKVVMRDDEEALHVLVEAVGVFLPDLRTQSVKDMIPAKLQKLKTKQNILPPYCLLLLCHKMVGWQYSRGVKIMKNSFLRPITVR